MFNKKKLPIGIDKFDKLIESGFYYVDKTMPDLGIKVRKSLTERSELVIGKTPAQAITNWKKKVYKREPKANVYITDIKEYKITTSSEE